MTLRFGRHNRWLAPKVAFTRYTLMKATLTLCLGGQLFQPDESVCLNVALGVVHI